LTTHPECTSLRIPFYCNSLGLLEFGFGNSNAKNVRLAHSWGPNKNGNICGFREIYLGDFVKYLGDHGDLRNRKENSQNLCNASAISRN